MKITRTRKSILVTLRPAHQVSQSQYCNGSLAAVHSGLCESAHYENFSSKHLTANNMIYSLRLYVFLGSLLAVHAFAQTSIDLRTAQARYKQDVANCATTNPVANSRNCMKEARNALAEVRRGRMSESWKTSDYEKNALLRCEVHKGEDKSACFARIHGQGKIDGSVAGGGILRELTTTSIVNTPPQPAPPIVKKTSETSRPSGLMSNCHWVPPMEWVCK